MPNAKPFKSGEKEAARRNHWYVSISFLSIDLVLLNIHIRTQIHLYISNIFTEIAFHWAIHRSRRWFHWATSSIQHPRYWPLIPHKTEKKTNDKDFIWKLLVDTLNNKTLIYSWFFSIFWESLSWVFNYYMMPWFKPTYGFDFSSWFFRKPSRNFVSSVFYQQSFCSFYDWQTKTLNIKYFIQKF